MQRALRVTARRSGGGGRKGRCWVGQAAVGDAHGWCGGGEGGGCSCTEEHGASALLVWDEGAGRRQSHAQHGSRDVALRPMQRLLCRFRRSGQPQQQQAQQQQPQQQPQQPVAATSSTVSTRRTSDGHSAAHSEDGFTCGPLPRRQQQQQQPHRRARLNDLTHSQTAYTLKRANDSPRWQGAPVRWWSAVTGSAQHHSKQAMQSARAFSTHSTMHYPARETNTLACVRTAPAARLLHTGGEASPLYAAEEHRSDEEDVAPHQHQHHSSYSRPRHGAGAATRAAQSLSSPDHFRDSSGQQLPGSHDKDRRHSRRGAQPASDRRPRPPRGVSSQSRGGAHQRNPRGSGNGSCSGRGGDIDSEWMFSASFAAQNEHDSLFAQLPRQRWLQRADPLVLAQRMRSSHTVMSDVTTKVTAALEANDITAADACHMINLLGQAGRGRLALSVWRHITTHHNDKTAIHPELYTVTLRACALSGLVAEAEGVFEGMLACVGKLFSHTLGHGGGRSNSGTGAAGMGISAPSSDDEAGFGTRFAPSGSYGSSSSGDVHHDMQRGDADETGHSLSLYAPAFAAMQLVFATQGDVKRAYSVVRLMMARYHLPPHRSHRLHLLLAHARAGDIAGAEACYNDVVAPYISGDDRAHRYLLEAYATAGDVEGAERAFSEMSGACSTVDVRALTSLVKAYRVAGDAQGATATLQRVAREFALTPPTKAFTTAIRAHADTGDVRGAQDALRMMKQCGVAPDVSAFEFLIHAHLNSGDRSRAMEVYMHVFTRTSPLRPTPLIHAALLSHHMAAGDAAGAAAVLLRCQLHGHNVTRSLPRAEAWGVVEEATRALVQPGVGADGAQSEGEGQQQQQQQRGGTNKRGNENRAGRLQGQVEAKQVQGGGQDNEALDDFEQRRHEPSHQPKQPQQPQPKPKPQPKQVGAEERHQVMMMMMRNHAWHSQSGHTTHHHHHHHHATADANHEFTTDTGGSKPSSTPSSSSSSSSISSRTWCEFCNLPVLPIRIPISPPHIPERK